MALNAQSTALIIVIQIVGGCDRRRVLSVVYRMVSGGTTVSTYDFTLT
ncbi:MAG: hypothetical protein QM793_13020 [Muricomes sp.]